MKYMMSKTIFYNGGEKPIFGLKHVQLLLLS